MVSIEGNRKSCKIFDYFSTNKVLINYFATHIMQIATKFQVSIEFRPPNTFPTKQMGVVALFCWEGVRGLNSMLTKFRDNHVSKKLENVLTSLSLTTSLQFTQLVIITIGLHQ